MVAIETDFQQARQAPAGHAGGGEVPARSYSVADAAQALGVPERTLRDWIRAGKVSTLEPAPAQRGTRIPEGAVQELRRILAADAGGELRRDLAEPGDEERAAATAGGEENPDGVGESLSSEPPADVSNEGRRVAAECGEADASAWTSVAALEARLEGAQLAAKLQAQRYRETRTQGQDERERLLQMVERERTESREALARAIQEVEFLREQLQARTDAERELRLLLARTTQTMELMTERPALEAHASSTKRRTRWWMLWRR